MMKPLISPKELLTRKDDPALVLIDARSGADARAQYRAEHLQGAQFVDLETDLAHKQADAAQGGRHPLPEPGRFAELIGRLGIGPQSSVVVYDAQAGANAAARFWWMLKSLGHEQVQVLDGGYAAALAAGMPTSSGEEQAKAKLPYPHTHWQLPLADMQEVEKAAQDAQSLVIDVRDPARYRGETEPIDLVAGHIPGAVNIPFSSNLNTEGTFLPSEALQQKYASILDKHKAEQVIVHCGSGVTACHTLLAFAQAGLPIPKLYVGSWSEWSRNDKPIGKGA